MFEGFQHYKQSIEGEKGKKVALMRSHYDKHTIYTMEVEVGCDASHYVYNTWLSFLLLSEEYKLKMIFI